MKKISLLILFLSFSIGLSGLMVIPGKTGFCAPPTPPPFSVPVAPSDLTATAESPTSIALTWTDNSSNENGFTIMYKTLSGTVWKTLPPVGANVTSYLHEGCSPLTTYYYQVCAYNAIGDSAFSNEATAETESLSRPEAPSDLTATVQSTGTSILLAWNDNSSDEDGFDIWYSEEGGALDKISVGANVTSYLHEGLDPSKTYNYKVSAYNSAGDSRFSNEATGTFVPAVPSDLRAVAESSTSISLTWTDNSVNETGFGIMCKTIGGDWTVLSMVEADATRYLHEGLTPSTTYYYRVCAFTSFAGSDFSGGASATTLALDLPSSPAPPSSTSSPSPPSSASPSTSASTVIRLYIGSTEYYHNGTLRTMDTVPVIREGRTLLPIRYVAEPLGAGVSWDGDAQMVTVNLEDKDIELWIGQNRARVNGTYQYIDPMNHSVVPIIVPPGRTMLPLRFVAETLGCRVDWNASTQEVTVNYPDAVN